MNYTRDSKIALILLNQLSSYAMIYCTPDYLATINRCNNNMIDYLLISTAHQLKEFTNKWRMN